MLFGNFMRVLSLGLVFCAVALGAAQAKDEVATTVEAGDLLIATPWTRATPGGAKVGAGYMSIVNRGEVADTLVSGSSDIADRVEIHTMTMEGGVMRMRQLKDGLALAPKSVTDLKPGGYHVMFIGLKRGIAKGEKVAVTLTFAKAGKVDLALTAAPIGAMSPPGAPAGAGKAAGSRSGDKAGSGSGHEKAGSHSK